MTSNLRLAALAIVVLAVACGRAPGDESVPLVLETNAPSRPPAVMLVVRAGTHDVALPGTLYTTDWSPRTVITMLAPRVPVPWPRTSSIDGEHDPAIGLGTRTAPDFVTVSAFARVANGTGTPNTAPLATFECTRFTAPRCDFAMTGTGLAVRGLDRNLLRGGYITVFCAWHVARAAQSSSTSPPDDVSASWLFRVDDQHRSEASRP